MSMEEALCMKGGTGETSYTNNSIMQRSIIGKARPLLEENIRAILCSTTSPNQSCLTVADLGCSSGPNTLAVLQSIIDVTISTHKSSGCRIPEFNMFVNDLPQNDFNTIFKSLPGFYKKIEEENGVEIECFVSGTPGSFHGRLFPSKSVHFMHSSTSLHFLSQVPRVVVGKEGIYAGKDSPLEFVKAYKEQFGKDFNMFLRCRSKEIVNGGRMLLTLPCTHDHQAGFLPLVESANEALNKLASQGVINKEKLDAFNLQVYMPTIPQVKHVIEEEGSFILEKEEAFTTTFDDAITLSSSSSTNLHVDIPYTAKVITNTLRAGIETLLVTEFGEEMLDTFFSLVQDMIVNGLNNGEDFGSLNLALSLIRRL